MNKKILPPSCLMLFLFLSISAHFIFPVRKYVNWPFSCIGLLFIGIGIWLNIWADNLFHKYNTTVKPFEKPTHFIEEGPFLFSRNPMYLGMLAILIVVAVLLGTITPFIVVVAQAIVTDMCFIRIEEEILEKTFDAGFFAYKRRVRRWI